MSDRILNVILTYNNYENDDVCFDAYSVREDVDEPADAFNAAVADFLKSDDAAKLPKIEGSNDFTTWGDIRTHMPSKYLESRGLFEIENELISTIIADHDELIDLGA